MIVMDKNYFELQKAAKTYRAAYNRGYKMQEKGDHDGGQRILEKANAAYDAAKAKYPVTHR
jgi:hypothetical protein